MSSLNSTSFNKSSSNWSKSFSSFNSSESHNESTSSSLSSYAKPPSASTVPPPLANGTNTQAKGLGEMARPGTKLIHVMLPSILAVVVVILVIVIAIMCWLSFNKKKKKKEKEDHTTVAQTNYNAGVDDQSRKVATTLPLMNDNTGVATSPVIISRSLTSQRSNKCKASPME